MTDTAQGIRISKWQAIDQNSNQVSAVYKAGMSTTILTFSVYYLQIKDN
jgi:hypothetical protein